MLSFYKNLRAWRIHRELTQGQVAEKSGISRPNLVALEQGRRECTLFTLQRLAFALEVTPGTLLDQAPPAAFQKDLGRHEIDRIARSVITGEKDLPDGLLEIRDTAFLQASPLLQAAGIVRRERIKKGHSFRGKKEVEQVLRRVTKLLPHRVKETPA